MRISLPQLFARVCVALLACMSVLPMASGAENTAKQQRCLGGTFIQLLDNHRAWTTNEWAALFSYFRQLQLSQLVLQWTVYDDKPFFASGDTPESVNSPVELVLQMADEAGMDVLVGLVHDSQYWEKIAKDPPQIRSYLKELRQRSIAAAGRLEATVKRHRSFRGWYISQEVDDINWNEQERKQAISKYLQETTSALHALTPLSKIAISGFAAERTDPAALKNFWSALFAKAPEIDVLFFQDGIGVSKLQLAGLPNYFSAVRDAAQAQSRQMYPVIELFRQTAGEPLTDTPFEAVPASLGRIKQQLEIAHQYAPTNVAFSIPEYMSPIGKANAADLYKQYLEELAKPGAQCGTMKY